jgi:hypothetical protein
VAGSSCYLLPIDVASKPAVEVCSFEIFTFPGSNI